MAIPALKKIKNLPLRKHWLFFAALCLIAYAFFAHPDVVETSNHAYVLLNSIFKGRFFEFYNDVMARPFGTYLYYTNYAHYNIVVYIIFALAELPVYLFNQIFGTYNEPLLYFIGKLVSAGFFIACIPLVQKIAVELGIKEGKDGWPALFFALSPLAFFSCMVMGQYDSICLFFILFGFLYWLRGNLLGCALMLGAGATGKFFSLLLLVPLVLLREKRSLHVLKYGVASLWLLAPTTLLFLGRTGDMGMFNNIMVSRLFAAKIPAAIDVSLFPMLYFILCALAYLWRPEKEQWKRAGLWLCLAVLGGLFFFVSWHPQWVVLLAPFLVLTSFLEKDKTVWFWVDLLMAAGFFLYCFVIHPRQLEANMFDYGLLGALSGHLIGFTPEANAVVFYLDLLPVVSALPMVLFGGGLLFHVFFKLPLASGTPAARLSAKQPANDARSLSIGLWLLFGGGMAVWLLPTLFTWLKAFYF